ncbi:polysaccharide deacetylase family protein [Pseudoduganella violacea]|uniref:Peptidoglycan/xylan/chitin deacetylase (PgdA/CDA1 family) n=1 Tax=Pseudoduganella violacea TaxID=1715466 RepID=A0A7W5B6Z7_9BURK|nr:polysaccharide deacetylase family protein [Pseudoduganella violacea]MBB3117045.1 peptidoglycan/xylan/chitin deacetylase (PgdA/CDA1 family) [Pseudoduganella violacea]
MSQYEMHGGGSPLLEKGLLRVLSPGGRRGLSILIYHRVLPQKDPLFPGEVDREEFDQQLALLKSRFTILPLLDAVRRARSGDLPPRAACITFDDGYADNAEVALPLLLKHGLHATFFIATGFLNGGRMWNDSVIELARRAPGGGLDASSLGLGQHALGSIADRQRAIPALIGQLKYLPMEERLAQVNRLADLARCELPADLMMNTAQLHKLRDAGMGLGAHTVNHPILARLPAAQARQEIASGKAALEDLLGQNVLLFAYPNGKPGEDYLPEHVSMVRELGFEGAVSTAWGASKGRQDVYQLPRFTPWDRSRLRFVLRLARNLTVSAQLV